MQKKYKNESKMAYKLNALKNPLILKNRRGTPLVVQWLRIRLPMQGAQVGSLVRELQSHMPWGN